VFTAYAWIAFYNRNLAYQVWARGITKEKTPIPCKKLKNIRFHYDVTLCSLRWSVPISRSERLSEKALKERSTIAVAIVYKARERAERSWGWSVARPPFCVTVQGFREKKILTTPRVV